MSAKAPPCYQSMARISDLLKNCSSTEGLGIDFGGGLYQVEVDYLVENEWAQTTDDIVWRRSKKGLRLSADQIEGLAQYLLQLRQRTDGSNAA